VHVQSPLLNVTIGHTSAAVCGPHGFCQLRAVWGWGSDELTRQDHYCDAGQQPASRQACNEVAVCLFVNMYQPPCQLASRAPHVGSMLCPNGPTTCISKRRPCQQQFWASDPVPMQHNQCFTLPAYLQSMFLPHAHANPAQPCQAAQLVYEFNSCARQTLLTQQSSRALPPGERHLCHGSAQSKV